MQATSTSKHASWLLTHPLTAQDRKTMVSIRAMVLPNKGSLQGIEARVPFSAIMERVAVPAGVEFSEDRVGGISGWWCKPHGAPEDHAAMHIHGGWFNWGSAKSFRNLAGHIAKHSGVPVFLPDYRLAPEHPFPAASDDIRSCYEGFAACGYTKLAVTGDSAGGNLALGLLSSLSGRSTQTVVAGVAISPVTDLSLSGESWTTLAETDPLFTRKQATGLVQAYLAGHASNDPKASPLFSEPAPVPVRVHVGSDEALLADSIRFVEMAISKGADVRLDVWEGMIHGFVGSVESLEASTKALTEIGQFLRHRFADVHPASRSETGRDRA